MSRKTTLVKALTTNQDEQIYGTFAEIGAGQEVARYFFQAGLASQTIAKSISAYDMSFSDEIYGKEPSGRYVCESRLFKMLEKEFNLLEKRLKAKRGDHSLFFAYANTVTTSSDQERNCHGWMGVRFQTKPNGPYSDVVMHVRMLDRHRLQQQEILGILGVNLVYAAFFERENPSLFLDTLTEDIKEGRLAIDLIRFQGEAFASFNTHKINLELLLRGLSEFAIYSPLKSLDQKINAPNIANSETKKTTSTSKNTKSPKFISDINTSLGFVGDELFNKALFIQRGHFSPISLSHTEIMDKGQKQFATNYQLKNAQILPVLEITLQDKDLQNGDLLDDVLNRIYLNAQAGYTTIISHFTLFFELKQALKKYTRAPIGIALSASFLEKLFSPEYYKNLSGGLLEGLGRLLDAQTKIYVYPFKTKELCLTTNSLFLPEPDKKIYDYFIHQKWIKDLSSCEDAKLFHHSQEIQELIRSNNPTWKTYVAPEIKEIITKYKLYS